ncbi:MAG: thioredoxin domain-containing protein [Actinomycetota bacterium]|nr:thioredoxin domain-containing protein [Actinomycetota bacterium]
MPNHLNDASSPYLLQHADNPVDWWEWGDEAFAAAVDRDVPVFLSVGYSACHWCHVMAHESFEDERTARFLNDRFVSIKVDKEERPDVDRIYMDAVTATTGRGGWPMTVFLTPDAKPFYAGTYFPSEQRHGMPSFMDVLRAIDDAWVHRRDGLITQSDEITRLIADRVPVSPVTPSPGQIELAVDAIAATFDPSNGGFGRAPKFPQPSTLEFLLRFGVLRPDSGRAPTALAIVETTLDRMARGGIYDHLEGGFARYSVDDRWLVPHFEKMLSDNALLARLYLRAWQVLDQPWMLEVARETLDYLARDMMDPSGGIHSAEDADAEGREGSFAVWGWDELVEVLGPDLDVGATLYGATQKGNFEGSNILHLPAPIAEIADRLGIAESELRDVKRRIDGRLRERRALRVRPGRDDKVVTAWNGFALRAFAEAGAILGDAHYLSIAEGIAAFITGTVLSGDRLLRSWRQGRSGPDGFCDDYAASAIGLFELYQANGDERWYRHGERLTRVMIERFGDDSGGFFATAVDAAPLIVRPRNVHDNPTPSDNALAAEALSMLSAFTGSAEVHGRFERTVGSVGPTLSTQPAAHGHMLSVWMSEPALEIAIVGESEARQPFNDVVWSRFRPGTVVAAGDGSPSVVPLLEGRLPSDDARAFVCRGFVCDIPAESPADLSDQLDPS